MSNHTPGLTLLEFGASVVTRNTCKFALLATLLLGVVTPVLADTTAASSSGTGIVKSSVTVMRNWVERVARSTLRLADSSEDEVSEPLSTWKFQPAAVPAGPPVLRHDAFTLFVSEQRIEWTMRPQTKMQWEFARLRARNDVGTEIAVRWSVNYRF